jgi:hypothetical protein
LNNKAFGLLAFALPVLSAAVGFLIAVWEKDNPAVIAALFTAAGSVSVVLVLLLLIVLPRPLLQGEGSPGAYFTGGYYARDMDAILRGNIRTIHKAIVKNQKLMLLRGRLLAAGIWVFMAAPVLTLLVFLRLSFLN